jgi:single-strand DNA-binding protein
MTQQQQGGTAMAGSVNKVQLIGNVGRDPELRYLPAGEAVTTFSLATNRRWRGDDGQAHEQTEWHSVVAWRTLAEQCGEYLARGRQVYVEGRLQTRSWDDAASGQKRYRTEVVAERMVLLDSRGDRAGATTNDNDQAAGDAADVAAGEAVATPF